MSSPACPCPGLKSRWGRRFRRSFGHAHDILQDCNPERAQHTRQSTPAKEKHNNAMWKETYCNWFSLVSLHESIVTTRWKEVLWLPWLRQTNTSGSDVVDTSYDMCSPEFSSSPNEKQKKNLQLAFLVTTFGSLELKRFLTFPSAYLVELSCEKSLQVNPEIYIYIHWLLAWRQDSWCGRNGNACAHKLWIRCAHCQSHVRCVSSCQ